MIFTPLDIMRPMGMDFPLPARAPATSVPPPSPPPKNPDAPTGPYCVRVTVPLGNEERGFVGDAVGEGYDWNVLGQTMAFCEKHEKLGLRCHKPTIGVKRGVLAWDCSENVTMQWHTPPKPWNSPDIRAR
jgi:hypothetical protein